MHVTMDVNMFVLVFVLNVVKGLLQVLVGWALIGITAEATQKELICSNPELQRKARRLHNHV